MRVDRLGIRGEQSVSASISVSQMTTWLERLAPKSAMPRCDCDDARRPASA